MRDLGLTNAEKVCGGPAVLLHVERAPDVRVPRREVDVGAGEAAVGEVNVVRGVEDGDEARAHAAADRRNAPVVEVRDAAPERAVDQQLVLGLDVPVGNLVLGVERGLKVERNLLQHLLRVLGDDGDKAAVDGRGVSVDALHGGVAALARTDDEVADHAFSKGGGGGGVAALGLGGIREDLLLEELDRGPVGLAEQTLALCKLVAK